GGTDLNAGAKKYQQLNRATFVAEWAEVLADLPANGDVVAWEALPKGKQHILVIDHHLPLPDRDAGSLRMFNILDLLQRLGHQVTFLPDNLANIPPYGDNLQKRGVQVVYHPHIKSIRGYLEKHGTKFDTVILTRCDFARKHLSNVRHHAPQARVIFDTVDLHFLRQEREAALAQDPVLKQKAEEKKCDEFEVIEQSDETWVVSDFEQALLRSELPHSSIEVMSMIVDAPGSTTPFSLRHDYLFIGSFQHAPNVDAVLFFTAEIYPIIAARLPSAKFYIIGPKAPPAIIALGNENIIVAGFQPDVQTYFDSVRLSIAPLRFGAGVKGKINQSMGLGVPVVATSLAVEGMSLTAGEEVLIADDPETFAAALIGLYKTETLWQRISDNALAKTRALYSETAAKERLSHLFSQAHRDSFAQTLASARLPYMASKGAHEASPNGLLEVKGPASQSSL
ncbi:MAG TPA: glycosyltransferase, partial [Verrucomicrobiae bacterium]|nr:glycosyltransferase [Verrucomicrobiae bacterium]